MLLFLFYICQPKVTNFLLLIICGNLSRAKYNLKNTGKLSGAEVVQLYIRDLYGSVTRPVKELKGFKKISLNPGGNRMVEFEISAQDLAFYTADGEWKAEPGHFHLWVGTNSNEGLKGGFSLKN